MDKISKEKLEEMMNLIEKLNDCYNDESKKDEVKEIENSMKKLIGQDNIVISDFLEYWSWTSLEEVARIGLTPKPAKKTFSDEELKEIILNISTSKYSASETNHYLSVLEVETGLDNVSDYIFWPNEIGLELNSTEEEIIQKIFEDRK